MLRGVPPRKARDTRRVADRTRKVLYMYSTVCTILVVVRRTTPPQPPPIINCGIFKYVYNNAEKPVIHGPLDVLKTVKIPSEQ